MRGPERRKRDNMPLINTDTKEFIICRNCGSDVQLPFVSNSDLTSNYCGRGCEHDDRFGPGRPVTQAGESSHTYAMAWHRKHGTP